MWWGSQTGMWVWLMVAYGCAGLLQQGTGARTLSGALATEARERTGPRSARVDPRLPRAATLTGLIALFATGTAVAAAQYPDQDQPKYHPIAAINAHLIAALDPSIRTVLVMGSHDNASFDVRLAIDFALRRRVLHVLDPAAAVRLNPSYTHDPTGYQAIVCVSDAGGHPAGRVVGRFTPPQKPTIIVSLSTPGATPATHRPGMPTLVAAGDLTRPGPPAAIFEPRSERRATASTSAAIPQPSSTIAPDGICHQEGDLDDVEVNIANPLQTEVGERVTEHNELVRRD